MNFDLQPSYVLEGNDVLITSIVVWFLGEYLTKTLPFLKRYSIPSAVTGGLICSALVALVYSFANIEISFDMRIRDLLLLVFFSTIGLSAKFQLLKEGGKSLAVLLLVAAIFLVIQDLTGVLLAKLIGVHPAYGLFGGSISFAGGYGTAIAWGNVAEEAGLLKAKEIGIAFATFGLIAGGILGGPIAERLINKNNHSKGNDLENAEISPLQDKQVKPAPHIASILGTILVLALCVQLGDLVNRLFFAKGVMLPGFLTAMLVGIIITNTSESVKMPLNESAVDRMGEISLQLFLSMSLMSMQLWTLANAMGPILLVLAFQVVVMTIFASYIVYRVMGRSYDACVIASGFVGLGLGATPVGIANMNAVTSKYGPSPKAFLIVPLVGAFFIDLVNALVIKFFAALPIISATPF